jgi:hypothetical protein
MRRLINSAILSAAFALLSISQVSAANLLGAGCGLSSPTTSSSAVCTDSQNSSNPIFGKGSVLAKATNIIAMVAGIAAVIMIIIGGFQYVTSGGDSGKAASARSTIIGALIGLVIIVLARTIINFVITRLT